MSDEIGRVQGGMAVSDSEPQPLGLNGPAEALAIVCASVTATHKRRLLLQSGKMKKLTAPGIPRRSPIQVLTRPDPA